MKNISDNEVGFKTPTTSRFKDMMPTSGLLTPQTGHRKRMRDGEDSAMAKLGESPPKVQRTGERRASSSLTGWLKGGKDPTGGQKRAFHEEGDTSFEWDTEMDDEVPDLEPEKNEKKDSVQEAMSPSKPSTLLPPGRQISAPHTTAMTGNSRSQPPTKLPPRLSAIRSPSPPQISVVRPAAPQPTAPPNLVPSTFNPPPTPAPTRFKSTPLLNRYQTRPQDSHDSQLIGQTLTLLTAHQVPLTEETKSDLVNLLNMHDLRTLGIKKGRDISRMAIKTRDEEIQKLREKIESLEAERESWRIGSLKEHVNGDQDRGRRGR